MRKTTLFLFALMGVAPCAWAQEDDERHESPPPENLYFATDEFIYIPHYTLSAGFRYISGMKTAFSGSGRVASSTKTGNPTDSDSTRYYSDGAVGAYQQVDTRTKSDGTPYVTADGKTNAWSYSSNAQADVEKGYIAMHAFSADILDSSAHGNSMGGTTGFDLVLARDWRVIPKTRITVNWAAALGFNGINSKQTLKPNTNLTTLTDLYYLYGAKPPGEGYSGPVTSSGTVTLPSGGTQSVSYDSSTFISANPANRSYSTVSTNEYVTNIYQVKGAYATFRAGPTIYIPIANRLRASVSFGPALVAIGTDFLIEEQFVPYTGDSVIDDHRDHTDRLLPGFYVDANLELLLTPRAALYAGGSFQSTGSYNQSVVDASTSTNYTTKIDLTNLSGLRAGMNIRF